MFTGGLVTRRRQEDAFDDVVDVRAVKYVVAGANHPVRGGRPRLQSWGGCRGDRPARKGSRALRW
jgi:hypothetical protein